MGDIPEPRCKIWVGRDRTVQTREFEPVKLSGGVQRAFENIPTALEISDVMKEMESVVMESLNRQEQSERDRIKTNTDYATGVSGTVEKKPVQRNLNIKSESDMPTEKPTPRQIDFLRKHDVRYDGKTTKEQATKLISEEIASWKQ